MARRARVPRGAGVHAARRRPPPARRTKLEILGRLARARDVRVVVDDDPLVCDDAEHAGFTVVRATWATPSGTLRQAQEGEGRT